MSFSLLCLGSIQVDDSALGYEENSPIENNASIVWILFFAKALFDLKWFVKKKNEFWVKLIPS